MNQDGQESNPGRNIVTRRALFGLAAAAAVGVVAGCGSDAASAPITTSPRPDASGKPKHGLHAPPDVAPVAQRDPVHRVHDLIPGAPDNAIALTIDDGPTPTWTPQVLSVLRQYHVPATFFMIGWQAFGRPYLPKDIMKDGHQLANHTLSHPVSLTGMKTKAIEKEIADGTSAIYDAAGVTPKYFRAPGGAWNKDILASTSANGMIPIDWDIDPADWTRPGIQQIINKMLAAQPGDIMLCHDGGGDRGETVAALKTVIPQLQARGLTFVSL